MDLRPATLPADPTDKPRTPRSGRPWRLGLALLIAAWASGPAHAQDEIRNFKTPILVVETGGHHARVRSLVWQDDFTLLSGGEDKVVKVWDFHDEADRLRAVPADRPHLARSIRPMIWRGPAGIIYAMAVSPRPDAQGQSFLAVAGYGRPAAATSPSFASLARIARPPAKSWRGGSRPQTANPRRSDTPTSSPAWHSTQPVESWPPAAPTRRSFSGMHRRSSREPSPRCTRVASEPWHSTPTAPAWPRAGPMARSSSGTSLVASRSTR
jgi:hypothetical protein